MPDRTSGPLPSVAPTIAALAADQAQSADTDRVLGGDVVDAVIDAGFARHFVPREWGGDAGTFADLLTAVRIIGTGCTSTAWFASLAAGVSRMAAYLPHGGRAAVWGSGPDSLVVGALKAAGTSAATSGGWRLSGEWPYVSGADFADWALVCGMAQDDGDARATFFAVPRSEFTVKDTWHNAGMRGSGSNSVIVDDVFVPAERTVPLQELLQGRTADADEATCHTLPLKAVNGLTLTSPLLGAAQGALEAWCASLSDKLHEGGSGAISGGVDRSAYEMVLARTSGEIDAARLLLERIADVADRGNVSTLETTRASRDCAVVADLLATAVDRLFRRSGSRGQSEDNALQRFWRDVACGAGHSGLQLSNAAGPYTRSVLQDTERP